MITAAIVIFDILMLALFVYAYWVKDHQGDSHANGD